MELVLIIFAGILLIIWLIYFYLYSTQLIQISKTQEILKVQYRERQDEIPLLMMILTPHIVKSEEVFLKTIRLRHELLFHRAPAKEKMLQEQIAFILTVADHHIELTNDPRYNRTKDTILSLNSKIEEQEQEFNHQLAIWSDIRRKSLLCLFPGYFLSPPHLL